MSVDRVGRGVSESDLVSALQAADPRPQVFRDLGLSGNEEIETIFEIPEGSTYDTFDPVTAIAYNHLDREPLPEGDVVFSVGDLDAANAARRARASGKKPTLRLQNPREERLRQARIQRMRLEERDYVAQQEVAWLERNQLFKGRRPAPGEEFGAYAARIRGQTDRERQADERRRRRIEMHGNYIQDIDVSMFNAEQFAFELPEGTRDDPVVIDEDL